MTASISPRIATILVIVFQLTGGRYVPATAVAVQSEFFVGQLRPTCSVSLRNQLPALTTHVPVGSVRYARLRLEACLKKWCRTTFLSVAWNGLAGATITVGAMLSAVFVVVGVLPRRRNLVSSKPDRPCCLGRYLASAGRYVCASGPGTRSGSGSRLVVGLAARASSVPRLGNKLHQCAVRGSCRELGRRQCTPRCGNGECHLHARES